MIRIKKMKFEILMFLVTSTTACHFIDGYFYAGVFEITQLYVDSVNGVWHLWKCEQLCRSLAFDLDVVETCVRNNDRKCYCVRGMGLTPVSGLANPGVNVWKSKINCGVKTNTAQGSLLPGHIFHVDIIHAMTLIGVKSVELFYAEDIFDTVSPSENVYLWNDVERVLNSRIGLRKLRTGRKSGKYNRLIDYQDTSVPHGERVRTTFKIGDIHENTIWQVYTEDFDDNSTALTCQKLVVGKATRNCNLLTSTNITDTDALNQINVSLRLTTDEGCNRNLHNLTTHITTTHNIQIVAMHNQSPWRQQKVLPMNYVNKKKTSLTLAYDTFYVDSSVELIVTLQLLQSVKKQANILINVLYKSKTANRQKTSNHLLTVETSKQTLYNTDKFAPLPKVPASDLSIVENSHRLTFCSYDRRRIKFTCVKVTFDESIEVHVLSQHNRLHKIYAVNGKRALFQDSADRIQTRNMLLLTVDNIPTTLLPAKQINISDGGEIGQQFHVKQRGLWNKEDREIIKFP